MRDGQSFVFFGYILEGFHIAARSPNADGAVIYDRNWKSFSSSEQMRSGKRIDWQWRLPRVFLEYMPDSCTVKTFD